jgi:hypothetical protein
VEANDFTIRPSTCRDGGNHLVRTTGLHAIFGHDTSPRPMSTAMMALPFSKHVLLASLLTLMPLIHASVPDPGIPLSNGTEPFGISDQTWAAAVSHPNMTGRAELKGPVDNITLHNVTTSLSWSIDFTLAADISLADSVLTGIVNNSQVFDGFQVALQVNDPAATDALDYFGCLLTGFPGFTLSTISAAQSKQDPCTALSTDCRLGLVEAISQATIKATASAGNSTSSLGDDFVAAQRLCSMAAVTPPAACEGQLQWAESVAGLIHPSTIRHGGLILRYGDAPHEPSASNKTAYDRATHILFAGVFVWIDQAIDGHSDVSLDLACVGLTDVVPGSRSPNGAALSGAASTASPSNAAVSSAVTSTKATSTGAAPSGLPSSGAVARAMIGSWLLANTAVAGSIALAIFL